MVDSELFAMSATELGRLIATGKVTSEEVTRRFLDRLTTVGRELNALAEPTEKLALEQARQADREMSQGKRRGPLHGVPYGAKDLLATARIPTRWGSPAHADQVFDYDATVISRLREAGAVLIGKLAMIELAGGGNYEWAHASITGPCSCPWDRTRWAGGSSSGSGAAMAAGCVGFAIGTETWGSITVPAAFCGITGLRPTYRRVSRHGAMALSWSMDKIGPMARSAEDCALILEAIAGPDSLDRSSLPAKWKFQKRNVKGMRLGLLPTDYEKNKATDAKKAFDAAVEILKSLGATVESATMADFPYDTAADTIVNVEGASSFENLIRSERLKLLADKAQHAGFMAALVTPGVDYLRAIRIRAQAAPVAVKIFEKFDALIAPTLLQGAPPIAKSLNESFGNMGGNGGPGNLLGWPSISLPMGFTQNHLPLGLEVIGAPLEESTILSIAIAYQRRTDWHKRIPANRTAA